MIKNLLIIIGVILLAASAFFVYTEFFVGSSGDLSVEELGDQFVGRNIIIELDKIRTINFTDRLFQDKTYQSLVDRSIEVADEPTGRENPFAPIAGGVSSVITVGSTSTAPNPRR